MTKQDDHKPSLVERHALNRLNKVEKEKRRPYEKHKNEFSFSSIIIGFVFLVVVVVMLIGIIR